MPFITSKRTRKDEVRTGCTSTFGPPPAGLPLLAMFLAI